MMPGVTKRAGRGAAAFLLGFAAATPAQAGETTSYSYDALGRLVATTSSGTVNNGLTTQLGYDPAGNRSTYQVTQGSGGSGPSVAAGSFEAPEVGSGFLYLPSLAGAVFAGAAGIAGNGSAWGFAAAPDGDQVAFLQGYSGAGGSSISLQVSGLTPGARYQVAFMIAQRPGYALAPVSVAWDGTGLGTFAPPSAAFTEIRTASVTAAAATATLTFSIPASASDSGTGLDRITVVAAP